MGDLGQLPPNLFFDAPPFKNVAGYVTEVV